VRNPWRKKSVRGEDAVKIAASLRDSAPPGAPDFAGSILDRVAAQKPFVCRRSRKWVWGVRAALVGVIASAGLVVGLSHRYAPSTVDLTGRPAPLSGVVESVATQASAKLVNLRQTLETPVSSVESEQIVRSGAADAAAFVGPAVPAGWCCEKAGASCDADEWTPVPAEDEWDCIPTLK
jgi:hypothetical protein